MIRLGWVERFLVRDLLFTQAAVTLVLWLIITGGVLGQALRQVAEGRFPLEFLPVLVFFGSVRGLILLWPVALFLAFLLVLGRLQRDSEWIALQAGGVSFTRVYGVFFLVAVPTALLLFMIMSFAVPRLGFLIDQLRDQAETRSDLVGVVPGRFLEARVGGQTFFVERYSDDGETLLNVFLYREAEGQMQITVAASAQVETVEDRRYLRLMNGHHSVGKPGEGNFERMTFAQMRLQVPDPTLVRSRYSIDARPWSELWAARDQPRFRAEIEWRIALPVSVLVLTLLALPLGLMPPRSGRYARLPVAILVYALYANFLIVGKSWLADGQSPPGLGLWWAHALPLLLWAWWAWRQRFFVVWSRQRIRMPR